jgi:hypothetical protein
MFSPAQAEEHPNSLKNSLNFLGTEGFRVFSKEKSWGLKTKAYTNIPG